MKLSFLKIDKVEEKECGKILHIPTGGIQFEKINYTISLSQPVVIEMTHFGDFMNVMRDVKFDVYADLSLKSIGFLQHSLISIVAHKDFYGMVYEHLKRCKVVPVKKEMNQKELFAKEFGNMYMKLSEV